MKLKMRIIATLTIGLLALGAQAQTTNTSAPLNFFQQAASWGTEFNTNADYNWTNNSTIQFDTGIATTTGVGIADRMYVQYNITPKIGVGIMGQFVGVGSPFGAIEGTFQYALIQKFDFKLGLEADAGYDFNAKDGTGTKTGAWTVEPGFFAAKKMTANTYATIKYLIPVETKGKFNPNGVLFVGLGTTF